MDFQSILVYIILILAVVYLVLKFMFPKKLQALFGNKNSKDCGDGNCGCS